MSEKEKMEQNMTPDFSENLNPNQPIEDFNAEENESIESSEGLDTPITVEDQALIQELEDVQEQQEQNPALPAEEPESTPSNEEIPQSSENILEDESDSISQTSPKDENTVEIQEENQDKPTEISETEEVSIDNPIDTTPTDTVEVYIEEVQSKQPELITTELSQEIDIPKSEPSQSSLAEISEVTIKDSGETQSISSDDDSESDNEEEDEIGDGRIDLTQLDKLQLVELLEEQLNTQAIDEIRFDADKIKSLYYKIYRAEVETMRRVFIAEGGEASEFSYDPDPLEERLKQAVGLFKRLKSEFVEAQEKVKLLNLATKFEIIDKIKELINGQESLNKTFNDFKALQNEWHETGPVPQSEVKNMWESYHHSVEQFYDFIKINRELRDLDQRKNLEAKIVICEKAEELLLEPSVVKAFKVLQDLHIQWREIGPITPEKREEVWQRFKQATTTINKNHQDYFDELKKEQQSNLDAKTALVEKAEELAATELKDIKEWDKKSEELLELQKLWKTIGFATKKDNNKVFEQFRIACDKFFAQKRDFFKEIKDEQNENLQHKTDLCRQAEAIKDSDDWKATSNELIELQKKWKEIGPVPRKHSDVIWKRFRGACNEFFERKNKFFENIDSIQDDNLAKKQELIQKIKDYTKSERAEENIAALRDFQNEWSDLGHVPIKQKDKIQKDFREAINAQYDHLKIDDGKRNVLQFKQRLENLNQTGQAGNKKNKNLNYERDRILDKIRQLESDITLLDNNIGFFAKTKNAEALINDVKQKIERSRKQIIVEKQKLDVLQKFE